MSGDAWSGGGSAGGLIPMAGSQTAPRQHHIYVTLSNGYDYDQSFVVNHVPGRVEKLSAHYHADSITLGCTTITVAALEMLLSEFKSRNTAKEGTK